jgi:DNA-binding MarR family transcriptional regulator
MMSAYSPNSKSEHLLRLSSEVSRIAGTLARLSDDPNVAGDETAIPSDLPDVPVEHVRSVIRVRRLRGRHLSGELFADPAWDILLVLFHSELLQQRVAVNRLCAASAVPPTTALRWINTLVEKNLIIRRPDPFDGRRVFVDLAPETSAALRRYFAEAANMLAF